MDPKMLFELQKGFILAAIGIVLTALYNSWKARSERKIAEHERRAQKLREILGLLRRMNADLVNLDWARASARKPELYKLDAGADVVKLRDQRKSRLDDRFERVMEALTQVSIKAEEFGETSDMHMLNGVRFADLMAKCALRWMVDSRKRGGAQVIAPGWAILNGFILYHLRYELGEKERAGKFFVRARAKPDAEFEEHAVCVRRMYNSEPDWEVLPGSEDSASVLTEINQSNHLETAPSIAG